MTAILGIFAFYHDSVAGIIIDGKIIAAAQEERLIKKTCFRLSFSFAHFKRNISYV